MKKILTMAFLLITIGVDAQTIFEKLKNKKWTDRRSENKYKYGINTIYFTDSICCKGRTSTGVDTLIGKTYYRYYLSDSIVKIFNEEEIGKKKNGKYIVIEVLKEIRYNSKTKKRLRTAATYRIVKISDKELKLVIAEDYHIPGHKVFLYKNEGHILKKETKSNL